jgi:hypothetical protein
VPAWDSTLKKLQSIKPWRKIEDKTEINLDPAASNLFARKKREKSKPTSTRSQTPLPHGAGHHGRRRRERERSAGEIWRGRLKKGRTTRVYSPQG